VRKGLNWGLVLGAFWAFPEIVFTYVTGASPALDVFEIFLLPFIVSLLYQMACGAAAEVRPHRAFELLSILGIALAPVAYFYRGREQLVPIHFLCGVIPIVLAALIAWRGSRRPVDDFRLSPVLAAGLLLVNAGAALAFALRADRVSAITSAMLVEIGAYHLALMMAIGLALALLRGFAEWSLCVLVFAAAAGLAVYRGSGPPVWRPEGPVTVFKPTTGPPTPNVLLIVLDTVRARNLDLYGHAKPTFAKTGAYLKDGLVFDAATATGTFSLTSHGSLFTGLLPSAHGAHATLGAGSPYGRAWPDIETMADWLKSRGYATLGVSANDIFLVPWTGLQKGFDAMLASSPRGLRFTHFAAALRRYLGRKRWLPARSSNLTWTAEEVTNAAIGITGQVNQPFFLFLNYFDAHGPHTVLGVPPWPVPSPVTGVEAYDTEIAYVDLHVARLLRFLEENRRLDNTLVIVTADHGEFFDERKIRGHPAMPYEQSIHIPLALRLPGIIEAGRSRRRTGLLEVFQMVRDVVDSKPLDWLREEDATPRVLSEAWARRDLPKTRTGDQRPTTTVVYAANLKLIHRLSGRSELFDLDKDPAEEVNLIDSKDPRLADLREKMIREVMLRPFRGPGPAPPLADEAAERLRALGYLR
jgi:arylsulfatase A-like enzyme